jgi:hypothetical protein
MRPLSVLSGTMLGVVLLGAGSPGPDSPAGAAETPGALLPVAQEPACYLARGTMEEASQRPSPLGEAILTLGGQVGKLCYGRPSANNRTVMGELVPFGTPWRMGANEATVLHLPLSATVGGIDLLPGSYSLFAVPGPEEWEIVLNRRAERWGVPIDPEVREADMGSFTVSAHAMDQMVEQLTFRWEALDEESGRLLMEWEHTRIEIPVTRSHP